MSNKPVAKSLKHSLANSYALYIKCQNFHWNVVGENFTAHHEFFENLYKDLADAIDEIAERIRALDEMVPGTLEYYAKHKTISDSAENLTATQMLEALRSDHIELVKTLSSCLKTSEEQGDAVTADLMVRRLHTHEKNAWMINSMLEK